MPKLVGNFPFKPGIRHEKGNGKAKQAPEMAETYWLLGLYFLFGKGAIMAGFFLLAGKKVSYRLRQSIA
jgi:hypothetical protein